MEQWKSRDLEKDLASASGLDLKFQVLEAMVEPYPEVILSHPKKLTAIRLARVVGAWKALYGGAFKQFALIIRDATPRKRNSHILWS